MRTCAAVNRPDRLALRACFTTVDFVVAVVVVVVVVEIVDGSVVACWGVGGAGVGVIAGFTGVRGGLYVAHIR